MLTLEQVKTSLPPGNRNKAGPHHRRHRDGVVMIARLQWLFVVAAFIGVIAYAVI